MTDTNLKQASEPKRETSAHLLEADLLISVAELGLTRLVLDNFKLRVSARESCVSDETGRGGKGERDQERSDVWAQLVLGPE